MTSGVLEGGSTVAPAKTRAKVPLKRLLLAGGGLAVIAVAAWAGREWLTNWQFIESTDDAYVGGDITVIAPQVPGFIATVAVTDNQAVHAGDLLIKLDDREYRAALNKADAAVDAQRATLAHLDAEEQQQQAVIAEAQAGIASADAEITRSHDDQIRFRKLVGDSAVSIQSSQKADAEYKEAVAAGQKAQAALTEAQAQITVLETSKRQTEAALAGAVADQSVAQLNLGYTELRAPVDGTVGNRSAHVGAYATTGANLISLVPAKGLWVDANFKENQLAQMRPGLPVTITADVLPGRQFHGHVTGLAPATGAEFSILPAENATGNFTKIVQRVPVRVTLDGNGGDLGLLRPGLSVIAAIDQRGEGR